MNKFVFGIVLCAAGSFLGGCELFDYHPYDARVDGRTDINRREVERIEAACSGKDTIRFVLMGDTQRWYDETEDFVKDLNQRNDIDFVIHGGDISDFGMTKEFEWVDRIMRKLTVPYVALIGNHDIIGNGIEVYKKIYGEENFSFVAGKNRFVCLNTNALEFDYSHPVPDFTYIKEQIDDTMRIYDRTIVAMHVQPYGEQFNNNVADPFQHYLKMMKGFDFCIHAHIHHMQVSDIFGDGVLYYACDAMKSRSYLVFTLTPDAYEYEVVYY